MFTIQTSTLRAAVAIAEKSGKDVRQFISTVHLAFDARGMRVEATDGYKALMLRENRPVMQEIPENAHDVMLPRAAVESALKAFGRKCDFVELSFVGDLVQLSHDEQNFQIKPLVGKFPGFYDSIFTVVKAAMEPAFNGALLAQILDSASSLACTRNVPIMRIAGESAQGAMIVTAQGTYALAAYAVMPFRPNEAHWSAQSIIDHVVKSDPQPVAQAA